MDPTLYENVAADSDEMITLQRTTKLWTNFAKYG